MELSYVAPIFGFMVMCSRRHSADFETISFMNYFEVRFIGEHFLTARSQNKLFDKLFAVFSAATCFLKLNGAMKISGCVEMQYPSPKFHVTIAYLRLSFFCWILFKCAFLSSITVSSPWKVAYLLKRTFTFLIACYLKIFPRVIVFSLLFEHRMHENMLVCCEWCHSHNNHFSSHRQLLLCHVSVLFMLCLMCWLSMFEEAHLIEHSCCSSTDPIACCFLCILWKGSVGSIVSLLVDYSFTQDSIVTMTLFNVQHSIKIN